MKKSLKEEVAPPAPAAGAAPVGNATGNLSASAKKLQDRLAKVPGLDKLMSTVTKRDDAAEILAAIAEKLGGDKVAGSKALTAALNIAKEEEKLNEHAEKRIQAFVRYLFE
jgi:hypothetical protein